MSDFAGSLGLWALNPFRAESLFPTRQLGLGIFVDRLFLILDSPRDLP